MLMMVWSALTTARASCVTAQHAADLTAGVIKPKRETNAAPTRPFLSQMVFTMPEVESHQGASVNFFGDA